MQDTPHANQIFVSILVNDSIFIGWRDSKGMPTAAAWGMPSLSRSVKSLHRSRFRIVFDYFSKFRMNYCIYWSLYLIIA
jgi:hypothetical protein